MRSVCDLSEDRGAVRFSVQPIDAAHLVLPIVISLLIVIGLAILIIMLDRL